jgi:hypothetical protein
MKTIFFISAVLAGFLFISCNSPVEPEKINGTDHIGKVNAKATGTVEVLRLANKGNGDPNDKIMIADFNAHEEHEGQDDHGEFIFSVLKTDSTVHRVITIDIDWVYVDAGQNKSWFKGVVISDTKGCAGNGSGGHDEGCEGSGCSGDINGDHTEGCTGHDSGHDSGCSGDDGETHEDGCEGSGGQGGQGGNGGGGANGKSCRIGQILVVKVHDVSTPGSTGDGITWKWFDTEDTRVANQILETTPVDEWPHLCKKTILGGNLIVHAE